MTDLLSTRREVLSLLDDNGIPYELHEHERAFTIDDCLRMPFLGPDVTMCKNILLCNRQKTRFYLMLLRPHTPFRTAVVSKALGVSRLSFAPEDALEGRLHLTSGSVSPLGLTRRRKSPYATSRACATPPASPSTPATIRRP